LIKPYYEDEYLTIYNNDCREIISTISNLNNNVVTITSPPYNMGKTCLGGTKGVMSSSEVGQKFYGEYSDNLSDNDYVNFIGGVLDMSINVSRYTFLNIQYLVSTKTLFDVVTHDFKDRLKDIFIWKKHAVSQVSVKKHPRMATGFEFVFIYGKDNSKIFKEVNFPDNGYVPNIQTWYKKRKFKEHHATFPEALPDYFISNFAIPGTTIFDPFMGTGTTMAIAKALGFRSIGIELDKKYCDLAIERCSTILGGEKSGRISNSN